MTDQPNPPDLDVDIPIPSGLKVTAEHPYHILMVSNLAGSDRGSVSGALASGVVNVTADTFDDVMAAAGPSVNFTTTDPVAPGNVMVEVNLRFDTLRGFDPKSLVEQIPAVKPLVAGRALLVDRLRGKVSSAQLREAVGRAASAEAGLSWLPEALEWSPAAPAADPGAVDGLLGQIDLGEEVTEESAPPPKSPIGAAVAAAASDGPSIPAEEASALRRALKEIDRRVSAWLTAVLHAPPVQVIEAAWRSLAFLVSRMDFRKGLRLSLLHAGPALLDRFRTLLIDPVFDEGAAAPDLIVVDWQYSVSAPDVEVVDELAQHAASLPAVVLAGASPQFFGVKHAWQLPTLPPIPNMLDQWQFAKWQALRGQAYARSLGVVFGRCLLRGPHGRDGAGDLEFVYREEIVADKDLCWANGVIAAAASVAQSFADIGWPTAMAGYVHGRVEGFTTAMGGKKGDKKFGPTDTLLKQEKIEEMALAGLNAAVGVRDHDDVLIWNGLTAARAQRGDPDAFLEISLPYQLFAGRLSALLYLLKVHLAGMPPNEIGPFVTQHLRSWIAFESEPTAEQLSVQTRPSEDTPGTLELAVTVTPPQSVLPGGIPVVMGYRIG